MENHESEEAINKRCQSQLAQAQSQSGNKYCADCDARLTGSVWTSWNLGIFICIQCSAKHRGLGAHISKVRSVCEDSWNSDQVAYMQAMGNSKSRSIYEAGLDPNFNRSKLQNDDLRQTFIRDKYVNKRWVMRSSNAPVSPRPRRVAPPPPPSDRNTRMPR